MKINPLKSTFTLLGILICLIFSSGFIPNLNQEKHTIYDGKTGLGNWFVCDKKKVTIFEKDKRMVAYINQSHFECFGIFFEPMDVNKFNKLNFLAGIENSYKEDTISLYVSLIDNKKNATNFKQVMLRITKGPVGQQSISLEDLIIKDQKVDFTHINSVLYYVGSKRDTGFWGNLVIKEISML
jgi:hypothetical protein